MDYRILPPGNNAPEEVYAIVEIPKGEGRLKYEFRLNGMMIVDRIRGASQPMYPVHYCGMNGAQAPDGDPPDLLILGDDKLKTGDVIAVRPVCVFWMSDEKGIDPKIVCVPADSVTDAYRHIRTLADVPAADRKEIETFFGHYKEGDLVGKFSSTSGWDDLDVARQVIVESIDRWNKACAESAPAAVAAKVKAPAVKL
jgi:inorganic pyrophosphatase